MKITGKLSTDTDANANANNTNNNDKSWSYRLIFGIAKWAKNINRFILQRTHDKFPSYSIFE